MGKPDNFNRLDQLLAENGLPAATKQTPLSSVLQEAMEEIQEEDSKAAKEKAKGILMEARKIAREFSTKEKQLQNERNKFNKTLGKLINQLGGQGGGGDQFDTEEESTES